MLCRILTKNDTLINRANQLLISIYVARSQNAGIFRHLLISRNAANRNRIKSNERGRVEKLWRRHAKLRCRVDQKICVNTRRSVGLVRGSNIIHLPVKVGKYRSERNLKKDTEDGRMRGVR